MSKLHLADACYRLNAAAEDAVTYARLYQAVLNGRVPAQRDPSGKRWLVEESDLPKIGASLGITFQQPAAA